VGASSALEALGIEAGRDEEGSPPDLHETGPGSPTFLSRSSSATARAASGSGNFKALFEAIEREQAKRGTL
jgi:hypothetical protein